MTIDPTLTAVYRRTDYLVFADCGEFVLHIDEYNPLFANFLKTQQADRFALISACNPRSVRHPDDANQLRHQNFCQLMQTNGCLFFPALGRSPDQSWQEQSLLLLNLSRETALKWGRYLEQNAILYGENNAIPTLLFCQKVEQ